MESYPIKSQQLNYYTTLVLLCIGYFIDFYDLTIFSANYAKIIPELFDINNSNAVQLLYLEITNYYTVGIVLGSTVFGILGDKFGRTTVIRASILIYSISIFLSVFTHSITIFTLLRFISGFGLATEFATSSVLISELFTDNKKSNYGISILYASGILGGSCATFIGSFSWQAMFLFGSLSGLILYFLRKKLLESQLFTNLISKNIYKGELWQLINSKNKLFHLIKLFVVSTPFYFLISIIFMYPKFMQFNDPLASSITTLLTGFFIGNIISVIVIGYCISKYRSYKSCLWITLILYISIMPIFHYVTHNLFLIYSVLLGMLGGGYPVAWVQLVVRSYGTNMRNTATNILIAMGRGSGIFFNVMFSYWLSINSQFISNAIISVIIICLVASFSLLLIRENYAYNL